MTHTSSTAPTVVAEDGLRYKSKASGSAFGPASGATMSCIKCGRHRPMKSMARIRLAGRSQPVCSPSCEAVAAALGLNR